LASTLIKHWRLVVLALGIIVLIWVLYLLRTFIFPFAIGLVLAYLMMPAVYWLERKLPPRGKWPSFKRVISVLLVFILLICIIGGFVYFIVTAVIEASTVLLENASFYIIRSLNQLQSWLEDMRAQLPIGVQQEMDKVVLESGASLGNIIKNALLSGLSSIQGTFNRILGFAVLPFFLFYIMKDLERLKRGFVSAVTPRVAEHTRNVGTIVERVLGRYIRAQIMLGVVVGVCSFIGLWVLKIPYAPALAILAGVGEMIPTLGPWISGAVAVIVTLAVLPEKALWVVVLFVAVQLLENNLLVPRVQSAYLHIHPVIMIVLLVFGAYVAGFWGLLLAGPLAATLVEIFKYIRDRYTKKTETAAE
jgi:predicted PurR-regulated permease PerM